MFFYPNHKPEEFARPGEEFLTNCTIRPDDPELKDHIVAEEKLTKEYSAYHLRFDYTNLVLGGNLVTSQEFGDRTTDLRPGQAIGVAVYGILKTVN